MLALDHWVLDLDDPLYSTQQAFREVACRTGETDPNKLFDLALEDYLEVFEDLPPDDIQELFREWAAISAQINADPYMMYLKRMGEAECQGSEALRLFLEQNPWTED